MYLDVSTFTPIFFQNLFCVLASQIEFKCIISNQIRTQEIWNKRMNSAHYTN